MSCDCCIPTPDSILNDDSLDVFEEIIPATESDYAMKRSALWVRFRYRGIGNPDIDYWLQCMKDRYASIAAVWDMKIKVWKEYLSRNSITVSMSSSEYETVTGSENNPQTQAVRFDEGIVYLDGRTHTKFRSQSGLDSETVRAYLDAMPNPLEDFARDFDRLFAWVM